MLKYSTSLACFVFLCLSPSALASIIYTYNAANPITLAGPLPSSSQDLTTLLPQEIFGNFGANPNAVNVFAINIMQPFAFSALTLNDGAHYADDTELFLFNSSGNAIYGNDDISAINTFSCLPSKNAANPCPSSSTLGPLSAGKYFLAITRSNQMPWDNMSNYLFTQTADSATVVGPDFSAGGARPVAGWDGGVYTEPDYDNSYYDIVLTGTIPEPGTFLLFGGATMVGLLARRLKSRKPV